MRDEIRELKREGNKMLWVAVGTLAFMLVVFVAELIILGTLFFRLKSLQPFFGGYIVCASLCVVLCSFGLAAFIRLVGLIQSDRSFTEQSAETMSFIGWIACGMIIVLGVSEIFIGVFQLDLPVTAIVGGLMSMFFFLVGILAFALSRLIYQAAALREDSDLTV